MAALARDAHQRVVQARELGARGADGEKERQRVEGRLLDLEVVALEELLLQVLGGVAAARDVDRHLGGIEADAVASHLGGKQVLELEHPEDLGGVDEAARLFGELERAPEQLVAFHHRLLAGHVQARDQPVLRAGRGVHVEVLAEQVLTEPRIVDVDHGGLRERGEHLVRRLGGVIRAGLERRGPELGMEAREAVPGLVDDHLDALCVRRLDDRREVVAQAIVGAGGEDQRLSIGVLVDFLQQQLLRHRAVEAVLAVERRVEIDRVRAREHHAVVHALVAIAIEEQLLPRGEQGLEDHLVRGGGAVGGEVRAPRAERLRRHRLGLADHALRVHQRIEHRHRYRQVGVEHVLAHELVEVVHPGAAAQRLARGMAGGVPLVLGHPDVVLERVVERSARALLDLGVEDAVDAAVVALLSIEIAIHGLGEQGVDHVVFLLLGDQDVDVELGPEAGNAPDELQRRHLQLLLVLVLAVIPRQRIERVVDQHRLQVAVGLDHRQRFLGGGYAGEADAEGIIERARRGVEALDELAQHQVLIVDDEDAARELGHLGASV